MRIAMVCDIEEPVPPRKYGGSEWVVYNLATGLGKLGHTVDLYTTGDSKESDYYNLVPVVDKAIRTLPEFSNLERREVAKFNALATCIEKINKQPYDLVHDQGYWRLLTLSKLLRYPLVRTHHYPLSDYFMNYASRTNPDIFHVSISNNQRLPLPQINWVTTIYHGIDVQSFEVAERDEGYMLYLARMCDDKGGIEAAQIAHRLKIKLKVCAKVDEVDKPYFEQFKSYIDDQTVEFVGEVSLAEKIRYLKSARLLLAPIKWEEPFGLNFVEALASGVPVVAFARGSIPEIVKDGQTGFIVNQSAELQRGDWIVKKSYLDGLAEAIQKIYSLPGTEYQIMKRACRREAEEKFNLNKMTKAYEQVYLRWK